MMSHRCLATAVAFVAAIAVTMAAGCLPQFEERPWLVDAPRVLGVRSTPAEAGPGQQVRLEALVVDPGGEGMAQAQWAFCTEPRRAEERGGVSESCATGGNLAQSARDALIPMDACARFGPNPPPSVGDELPRRPADPDKSGGYSIPVQARTSAAEAFGFVRIRCDLAGATRPLFEAFERQYRNNLNPEFGMPGLEVAGVAVEDSTRVQAGARVELEAIVSDREAETFVVYDIERGILSQRREQLSVRWFVTAGELDRGTSYAELFAGRVRGLTSELVAPSDVGEIFVWAVLTDTRGGASWRSVRLEVE